MTNTDEFDVIVSSLEAGWLRDRDSNPALNSPPGRPVTAGASAPALSSDLRCSRKATTFLVAADSAIHVPSSPTT